MIDIKTLHPMKRNWLLRTSNIPRRFLGMEFSDLRGKHPVEIDDWVQDVLDGKIIKQIGGLGTTGVGLLFDGGPGLGKTTHAVISAMSVIYGLSDENAHEVLAMQTEQMNSRPVYYLTYPEFLAKKKATFDAQGEEKVALTQEIEGFHGRAKMDHLNVRILVLDDLGKEYGSSYDNAAFDEVLRSRYDRALPTIITTNVMLEKWETVYKSAMASFANEAFVRVPIVGSDQRGAK